MPVYNSITGQGTPPPPDDGSYAIVNITEAASPELEAPDPATLWGVDGVDTGICREGDNMTYGGGGGYSSPSNYASPQPTNNTDVLEAPPEEPKTVGVEVSLSAQVLIGASVKASVLVGTDGQIGFGLTLAGRAGLAVGVSAGASGVYSAQGVDKMGGVSFGQEVEAGFASAGVSLNVGSNGLEGPPTYSVSPPGAGVGVMVGMTSELEVTAVMTGPRTPEEIDAMLMSLN